MSKKKNKKQNVGKFYENLNTIPLWNFAKCLVDGDYSFLYEEPPTVRNVELETQHFEKLQEDYAVQSAGKDFSFETIKRILCLRSDIAILEASLGLLHCLDDDLKTILRERRVRVTDNLEKNAMFVSARIEVLTREYKNLIEKENDKKEDTKPTMEYFTKMLVILGIHFKFYFNIHEINVASFCEYQQQLNDELRQLQKSYKKNNLKSYN